MIVPCPNCSTRYYAPDDVIGETGRTARCQACGVDWFVEPQPDQIQKQPAKARPVVIDGEFTDVSGSAGARWRAQQAAQANRRHRRNRGLIMLAGSIGLAVSGYIVARSTLEPVRDMERQIVRMVGDSLTAD